MNPRLRRFHQWFLTVCILVALSGVALMFLGERNEKGAWVDLGMALASGGGAFAGISGFYFGSQVAFRQDENRHRTDSSERND